MIDLSISIVNYNNRDYLKDCLDSIYSGTVQTRIEVIVVDNGSTDSSTEVVRQHFPEVKIIENHDNRGFVIANNQGIRASQGRYVLSLNNDTLIENGTLDGLVRFMEEHPDVGACGPKVLNQDGTLQQQCRRGFPTIRSSLSYFLKLHRLFPNNECFGRYLMTHLDEDKTGEVDSVSGCCMMVRRDVIEKVGILDENFIMYGDDLDWCYRIKQAGWKVYYTPHVRITHLGGKSSRKSSYRCTLLFYHAMVIFYRKHYAQDRNCILNSIVCGGIYSKAAAALLINALRREKIVGSRKPDTG
jgi:hypothetical protein